MRMGKMAKFGIFSPAVYGSKIVLGQDKLNKIRGKGISLHSQAIGEFCQWAGAYHLRTRLIKLAKTNGDILGFLVWRYSQIKTRYLDVKDGMMLWKFRWFNPQTLVHKRGWL